VRHVSNGNIYNIMNSSVKERNTMSLFQDEDDLLTKEIESWKGFEYVPKEAFHC
jgi:hypothetical protein